MSGTLAVQAWGPAEPQKPQNLGVTRCVRDPALPGSDGRWRQRKSQKLARQMTKGPCNKQGGR